MLVRALADQLALNVLDIRAVIRVKILGILGLGVSVI